MHLHASLRDARQHSGVKVDNQYLSTLTAEFPASLARSMAQLMIPFVTRLGHRRASLRDFAQLLSEATISRRPTVCDGAGLNLLVLSGILDLFLPFLVCPEIHSKNIFKPYSEIFVILVSVDLQNPGLLAQMVYSCLFQGFSINLEVPA